MPTSPTPPIELLGHGSRLAGQVVEVPEEAISALASICETIEFDESDESDSSDGSTGDPVAEASRDWWPLALHWALAGQVPRLAEVVVRPTSTDEVVRVLQVCNNARLPLTVTGGRSGVCGAAAPVFGGVVLDATALSGVVHVDAVSGIVEVLPGTFGPDLENELQTVHGLSVGHFPQSFDLATVGGWVASRGAGQYSTRYGKIEDMVEGLEVVLADGRILDLDSGPAASSGPDLKHLLLGSEGTLGVVTSVRLRVHPLPGAEAHAAWSFASWEDGLEACRRMLRLGARPAVLRLYDDIEAKRSHGGDGERSVLLVLDEGHEPLLEATMAVVAEVAAGIADARPHDAEWVERWKGHRNDTSALQSLTHKGFVVDTMEIAAPWRDLIGMRDAVCAALMSVPHARAASCHLSHSYGSGACLYFTFAATPPADAVEATYVALWDVAKAELATRGANLSHHHGIGLNQARYMRGALGDAGLGALGDVKRALDPHGILNPGKLGLPSTFGTVGWPSPAGAGGQP